MEGEGADESGASGRVCVCVCLGWGCRVWGGRVLGQFSTSGIYEPLRYAVIQKCILKLTKRPSVQAVFFQESVALNLGLFSGKPQTIFLFMRHFVRGFKPAI